MPKTEQNGVKNEDSAERNQESGLNVPPSIRYIIAGIMIGGTSLFSRYIVSEQVARFLGSHATRSNLEHSMESFAVFLYLYGLEISGNSENNALIKISFLFFRFAYVSLLFNWEYNQSKDFNRALQWEQLLASGLGILLAQLFFFLQEERN